MPRLTEKQLAAAKNRGLLAAWHWLDIDTNEHMTVSVTDLVEEIAARGVEIEDRKRENDGLRRLLGEELARTRELISQRERLYGEYRAMDQRWQEARDKILCLKQELDHARKDGQAQHGSIQHLQAEADALRAEMQQKLAAADEELTAARAALASVHVDRGELYRRNAELEAQCADLVDTIEHLCPPVGGPPGRTEELVKMLEAEALRLDADKEPQP